MNGSEALASGAFRLQPGGTLNPNRHVYIERSEDAEALHLLRSGEYVNILSSRQMGKSSLMVRMLRELRAEGVCVATVDLAAEIGAPPEADSFYLSLLRCIARDLDVEIVIDDWWRERSSDSLNRRFSDFFQIVLPDQIRKPIVIFFDEIDSTLRLSYTDDLFTAIRGMYNQRATVASFEHITFCLLGVASPNELIKDRRTTPYNVGTTIELRDFDASRDNLKLLDEHLNSDPEVGAALLERVLHWTGGHPYLTVKLCVGLADTAAKAAEDVDRFVEGAFTSLDRLSVDPHFQAMIRFLETRLTDDSTAIRLYARIIRGAREPDRQTIAHSELKLSGLVKRDEKGYLVVRNRIYRRLFDAKWSTEAIPTDRYRWYRNYAIAASTAILALIMFGIGFYFVEIRPGLEANLGAKGVVVKHVKEARGGPDLSVQFPAQESQQDFAEAIASLAKIGRVVELSLKRTAVTDLAPLAGLTTLQSLDLSLMEVDNILPLAGLTALRLLNLSQTTVPIGPLARLTALRSIDLSWTQDANIAPLAGLTSLKSLNLSGTPVNDIAALTDRTTLRSLNLSFTSVAKIGPLAGLTGLVSLDLSSTYIADITPLVRLTSLTWLSLAHTRVGTIASLAGLRALTLLDLSGTPVADIAPLAGLTALKYLDLSQTQIADVAPLAGLTALERLNLAGCGKVSDITAITHLTGLQELDLSGTGVDNNKRTRLSLPFARP